MNFLLNVKFDFKNKSSVEKIQNFERFLSLVIIVVDELRKKKIDKIEKNKEQKQEIKKLIKNNTFGLCKNDYDFLFKTLKKFNKGETIKSDCIYSLTYFIDILNIILKYITMLNKKNIDIDALLVVIELDKIWNKQR